MNSGSIGNECAEKVVKGTPNSNSVLVIIPVYQAFEHVENLLNDLLRVFALSRKTYRFLFSDDASLDSRIQTLLSTHPFIQFAEVKVIRRAINGGFVVNVNSAMVERRTDESLVLLNTDVRFDADFIETFLELAVKIPNVASITPLSTNATLASLLNWPNGGMLSEKFASRVTQSLTKDLFIDVPTGVGFCMFMNAKAINHLGSFSIDFGAGYGEETDWCLRAKMAGYRNLLSLGTFVAHVGTQSFTTEQKKKQQAKSSKIIVDTYPLYDVEVSNHFYENSWRLYRLKVLVQSFAQTGVDPAPWVRVLHGDPESPHAGGTEKFVRRESMRQTDQLKIEIFPRRGELIVNLFFAAERISSDRFSFEDLSSICQILFSRHSKLELHHWLNWPETATEILFAYPGKLDIFIHDFWLISPKVNLSHDELDDEAIDETLRATQRYRESLWPKMLRADLILAPSAEMKRWVEIFYPDHRIVARLKVREHSLSYLEPLLPQTPVPYVLPLGKTIAFVGSLHAHKGAVAISKAIPLLQKRGFQVKIFGSVGKHIETKINLPAIPYQSSQELEQQLNAFNPSIVYFNSLTPESFCFAFYEAVLLSPNAIPVVSPIGNPACEVRKHGIGLVAEGFTAQDIVNATEETLRNPGPILERLKIWKKTASLGVDSQRSGSVNEMDTDFKSAPAADNLLRFSVPELTNPVVRNLFFRVRRAFYFLDKLTSQWKFVNSVLFFANKFIATLSRLVSK